MFPGFCQHDFNPHFRKGSDNVPTLVVQAGLISIHTSAREVTVSFADVPFFQTYFNPHFRKGSDIILISIALKFEYFNPHFRKGRDYDLIYHKL